MGIIFILLVLYLAGPTVAPPPKDRGQAEATDNWKYNTEGLSKEQAQDQEYFRYLTQVVGELENDPEFKHALNNATEDDIKSGKLAEKLDFVGHNVRAKLDEVKRMEVEYQRDLLKQSKDHMKGIDRNYWNPMHHDNKETFEKEDLKKLLSKHNDMMAEQDVKRREEFKNYELEKEHEHKEKRKNMTDEEKHKDDEHNKPKPHEKLHEPGHKAQLEEVWEKEDGLDPEAFDSKTFFNLHDKNQDGNLDMFEIETMFLADLDKAYNESDPDTDTRERDEEMQRMREHVMKSMDKNKDGLVSQSEFLDESKENEFETDNEWKPLTDEDQYSEEELKEYEKRMLEGEQGDEHEEDGENNAEDHH